MSKNQEKSYPSDEQALRGGGLWSRMYFAGSSGGAPIDGLRKYIAEQNKTG